MNLTGVEHDLKIWPPYFQAVATGLKPWEFRVNDRNYRVGDVLLLREWNPRVQTYTGRFCRRVVTFILPGGFGVPAGHVIMSLLPAPLPPLTADERWEVTVMLVKFLVLASATAALMWWIR